MRGNVATSGSDLGVVMTVVDPKGFTPAGTAIGVVSATDVRVATVLATGPSFVYQSRTQRKLPTAGGFTAAQRSIARAQRLLDLPIPRFRPHGVYRIWFKKDKHAFTEGQSDLAKAKASLGWDDYPGVVTAAPGLRKVSAELKATDKAIRKIRKLPSPWRAFLKKTKQAEAALDDAAHQLAIM